MLPFLNKIEEDGTVVTIVLVHELGLVKLILLIQVVFWQVVFVLFEEPRYVCLVISLDIGINICRIGIGVESPVISSRETKITPLPHYFL
jgi:hypothetical protein